MEGRRVLVNGATGGVGSVLVQICQGLGAEVVAVCSGGNVGLVKALGAHEVSSHRARGGLRTEWLTVTGC
jgi:NADPH:quinone reductase-like Zn-dependent oxidoreductase